MSVKGGQLPLPSYDAPLTWRDRPEPKGAPITPPDGMDY